MRWGEDFLKAHFENKMDNIFIKYAEKMKKFGFRQAYFPPNEYEIYNLLNPIKNTEVNQNILLPIHLIDERNPKNNKWFVTDIFDSFGSKLKRKAEIPQSEWNNMKWLSDGEKKIIQSFYPNEKEYYPDWLK